MKFTLCPSLNHKVGLYQRSGRLTVKSWLLLWTANIKHFVYLYFSRWQGLFCSDPCRWTQYLFFPPAFSLSKHMFQRCSVPPQGFVLWEKKVSRLFFYSCAGTIALKHCLLLESAVIYFFKNMVPMRWNPWISAPMQFSCTHPFPECVSVCVSPLHVSFFPPLFFFLDRRWHFHWPFDGSPKEEETIKFYARCRLDELDGGSKKQEAATELTNGRKHFIWIQD